MVDCADTDVVAVLTRAPSSGGKTRLFRALGVPPDATLLRALLLDTIEGATTEGVRLVVAVTPGSGCAEVELLAPGLPVLSQSEGRLGERMRDTMQTMFAAGARRVALIGSDLPEITSAPIAAAFAVLQRAPDALVLGPATDGGYYLLGASRLPGVFEGIGWGSTDVMAQTRRAAAAAGLAVHTIDPLSDVDTVDDLRRVHASARGRRTAAWVRDHLPLRG